MKLELPESAAPLYPQTWRPINAMTIAFGHGMAVTPVHLAMGVAGIANNGVMHGIGTVLVPKSLENFAGLDR